MFRYFESKLYLNEYDNYFPNDIETNDNEKKQQTLNEEDTNDKAIINQIEPLLYEIDNIDVYYQFEKKNIKKMKIKKMKTHNIKRGNWQCKYCYNINYHFRTICNVCCKNKV